MTDNLKNKSELSIIRIVIQAGFVLLAFLIGLRHLLPGDSSRGGAFDAFCPFGAIETMSKYLSSGQTLEYTNLLNFSVLLAVIGVSIIAGRAFCGWMCPLGTLQDYFHNIANRIFKKKNRSKTIKKQMAFPIQVSGKFDKRLRYLKYPILVLILLASTVASAPPLHDICPARAIFNFQLNTPLLVFVVIMFVLSSMVVKRFTCKYLCPFGASLAIFDKVSPIKVDIDQNNCVDCGICEMNCPMDIQNIPENIRSSECIRCLECLESCKVPDTIELKIF